MSRIKELFMEYQQQMSGSNADLVDDEYQFQKWLDEKEKQSIFPTDLFYDDEYYKSTYHPSIEEENENRLYTDIEQAIVAWNIDGTKTAGSLTREILTILKKK